MNSIIELLNLFYINLIFLFVVKEKKLEKITHYDLFIFLNVFSSSKVLANVRNTSHSSKYQIPFKR